MKKKSKIYLIILIIFTIQFTFSSCDIIEDLININDTGSNDTGNNDTGNNDTGNNDTGNNDTGNNDTGNNDNNEIGHFTTSSGTTDLNYADTTTFATEYKKLGHTHDGYTQKVKKSQLKNLLTSKTIFHFHSGHGDNGGLILCTDGSLYAKDLKGAVQTKHSVFATCITLKTSDWFDAFGSNAYMVMGFTKTITDGSALTMAKKFPARLKNGETYLKAWYNTNIAISGHKDRWATYIREGSKIVLYSAASGNTPKYSFEGTPVALSDQVTIDSVLLDEWKNTVKYDRSSQVAIVEEMEKPLGRDLPPDTWPKSRSYITAEEAKTRALTALNNQLLVESELDSVIPIQKCDRSNVCFTVAHQVYFTHQYNDLNLRSNSIADYVSILVNDEGIASIDVTWSKVTPLDDTILDTTRMLTVSNALRMAAESISNISRKPVNIVKYEAVYGIATDEDNYTRNLVPAYEFIGNDGERFVVSAVNGKLIY